MTLITTICHKNEFVLVSSDSKEVAMEYDYNNQERLNDQPYFVSEGEARKARLITNNVFLVTSGRRMPGDIIELNLRTLVKEDYYLEDCIPILEELLTRIKNLEKPSHDEIESVEDIRAYSLNFIWTEEFGLKLVGFTRDGRTGMVNLWHDGTLKLTLTPLNDGMGDIVSPSIEDNKNYVKWLYIKNPEKRTIQNFISQVVLIHAKLSMVHERYVSSDCNLFCLLKTPEGIQYKEYTLDSSELYEFLEANPQLDHSTHIEMHEF